MVPETGTLTLVLKDFLEIFKLGQAAVSRDATSLLSLIAAIELTLVGLGWAATGSDALTSLFRKILLIAFFVFVIDNYESLLRTLIEGFIHTGKTAATGSTDVFASFRDPSSIVDVGFQATLPIVAHIQSLSLWPPPLFDTIFSAFALICILAAFFIIAVQVFVTYLEFAMISTVALIFIPFGVFRHTAFLTERTFAAVISFGVKLMVLGLIVSVAMPLLRTLELPPDPTFAQLFQMIIVCLSIAGLAWHAPGLASGLLTGAPSLSAHTAFQTAAAGAAVGASAPVLLSQGGSHAIQAASFGLGAVSGNLQVQAANRAMRSEGGSGNSPQPPPSSPLGRAAGALPAYAKAVGQSFSQATKRRTTAPLGKSFEKGRESAVGYRALREEREQLALNQRSAAVTEKAGELPARNIVTFKKSSEGPGGRAVYADAFTEEVQQGRETNFPPKKDEANGQ